MDPARASNRTATSDSDQDSPPPLPPTSTQKKRQKAVSWSRTKEKKERERVLTNGNEYVPSSAYTRRNRKKNKKKRPSKQTCGKWRFDTIKAGRLHCTSLNSNSNNKATTPLLLHPTIQARQHGHSPRKNKQNKQNKRASGLKVSPTNPTKKNVNFGGFPAHCVESLYAY